MKGYKIVNFEGEQFINCLFLEEIIAKRIIECFVENGITQRLFLKIHPVEITTKDNKIIEKTTGDISHYMMTATLYILKFKQTKLLKRCLNIHLVEVINKIDTANTGGYIFTKSEIKKIINTIEWDNFVKESNQNGYNIVKI